MGTVSPILYPAFSAVRGSSVISPAFAGALPDVIDKPWSPCPAGASLKFTAIPGAP